MTAPLDLQVRNSTLVGRFARIVTDSSIFDRARIVRETEKTFTVSYVSRTDHSTGQPEVQMEIVKKDNIVEMRLFVD